MYILQWYIHSIQIIQVDQSYQKRQTIWNVRIHVTCALPPKGQTSKAPPDAPWDFRKLLLGGHLRQKG